jgi:hypothetical protein
MNIRLNVLIPFTLVSCVSVADVSFSGFASINAGKVLSGSGVEGWIEEPTFLADYPLVSVYTEDVSFKPESLFGLQVRGDLSEGLSFTAQIVARGADDFNAKVEWAYLSYEINDQWTLQAGKKRLPLFYYSDFFDVGYAYTWMRPPADLYTWQIFNYNGINALYSDSWGDWSVSGNIYTGSEDDSENKLLTEFFFREPTREIWTDIVGGVFSASYNWFEVRVTHMQYKNERYISGERQFWDGKDSRDGKFYGLSLNADMGDWFVLTELNRLDLSDTKFDSRMITAGYRVKDLTPYVAYSEFETKDEEGEAHDTTSIGLRWDFHPSAAFKIQWDKVHDEQVLFAEVAGDSKALSVGIDLVF